MMGFSTNSFIAGVMLGILLTGIWFFRGDLALLPMSSALLHATSTAVTTQESSAISVTKQSAGDTVTVESVTVPPPGVWVAVREITGGDLGNVLGAVHISGPLSTINVPLLRATAPDRTYAVELYRDDNNGVFDAAVNSVYIDFDTGARVVAYFTTTE
ncbi:MAG: hypothetical protein NT108_01475 [Candidatus Kaiserbacteria bacterium]|nr:hypothetical protein [Candidatus Kaiserbacteria bacterium]